MKTRYNVNIAVELDSDDWAEAYGIDPADGALIRQDITTSLLELVEWHLNERLTIPAAVSESHGSS
jgi:hypothetical protein